MTTASESNGSTVQDNYRNKIIQEDRRSFSIYCKRTHK